MRRPPHLGEQICLVNCGVHGGHLLGRGGMSKVSPLPAAVRLYWVCVVFLSDPDLSPKRNAAQPFRCSNKMDQARRFFLVALFFLRPSAAAACSWPNVGSGGPAGAGRKKLAKPWRWALALAIAPKNACCGCAPPPSWPAPRQVESPSTRLLASQKLLASRPALGRRAHGPR